MEIITSVDETIVKDVEELRKRFIDLVNEYKKFCYYTRENVKIDKSKYTDCEEIGKYIMELIYIDSTKPDEMMSLYDAIVCCRENNIAYDDIVFDLKMEILLYEKNDDGEYVVRKDVFKKYLKMFYNIHIDE